MPIVCALLVVSMLPANARAAPSAAVALGMSYGTAADLTAAGAPPTFQSFWVGSWTLTSGWGALDTMVKSTVASGGTPLVYWYYWGDSITPSCVENGCSGKSRAQWDAATQTLADHLRADANGAPVIVVLENEFNKNGIDAASYAPTFDAYLGAKAATLKAVPGVRLTLGLGAWGEANWGNFPKAIAASDTLGFQLMRASTKDSTTSYANAPDKIAAELAVIQKLGKPALLYDLALSSYPDATWADLQAKTLGAITARLPEYGSNGLQGIIYRELKDNPSMSPANYYGYAEQHWGLRDSSGNDKPALASWKAAYVGTAPPPPPPPPNTPPVAQMTAATSERTVNVSGAGSSDADGDALTYAWAFGDGATATARDATHAYPSDGSFTVTLTVSDGHATSAASRSVTVKATPPPPAFAATFDPSGGGNSWWVQTKVSANEPLSAVCARVNGGACQALTLRSWGAWAASFNVPDGARVAFVATSAAGHSAASADYAWPTGAPFMAANFTSSGNAWWVQTFVSATQPVKAVCASIAGGACKPLALQSWGGWAASFYVAPGSKVTFTATGTQGGSATSAAVAWPAK